MVLGSVRARRKLWLLAGFLALLCSTAASAAASPDIARRDFFRSFRTDARSAWAIADLNGDHVLDVVTASSARNRSGSYTHLLRIGLSTLESAFFSFADANSQIRLTTRDVDGDHDADLIVLGAISPKPIGLWLNDGKGHFRHSDASGLATETQNALLQSIESDDSIVANLPDDQTSLAVPRSIHLVRQETVEQVVASVAGIPLAPHCTSLRSRAPPR